MQDFEVKERLREHLEYLCSFDKLSGEPEAYRAVEYILDVLEKSGISCHEEDFPAYLSNPVSSVLIADGEEFPCRPRSFSESTKEMIEVPLIYDPGTKTEVSLSEQKRFMETVAGKLVLGYGFDERYAKLLEQHGAAGWIQIWTSDEDAVHEDTVSPVWGTPDMDSSLFQLRMPVVAVSKPCGEKMIRKLKTYEAEGKQLFAQLSSEVDTDVKNVALPIAEIPGKSRDFVLLSGHYDTWYRGAFDNCTANALALELARYMKEHQDELFYSLRIAWWPGHSNGRYMGSTWYCDHHWDELEEHCIAHLNLDLLGSKGADHTLAIRTAGLEGEEWLKEQVRKVDPAAEMMFGRIGRGADQSLWGAEIPYHINPRYEAKKERKHSDAPGPGVYWWHTIDDTFDKIDLDGLLRDGRVVGVLLYELLSKEKLPADYSSYAKTWLPYFETLKNSEEHEQAADEIETLLKEVLDRCETLEHIWGTEKIEEHNRLCRLVGGVFSRLMHSTGSAYEQDTSFAYGPLQLLKASAKALPENSPADWSLFYQTTFVRQRNRMVTELRKLLKEIDLEFRNGSDRFGSSRNCDRRMEI